MAGIFCTQCGQKLEADVKFCTQCGAKTLSLPEAPANISSEILGLANDFLAVEEVKPGQFEFRSQAGAKSPVQKIKIKYEALAQFNPEKKELTFWEMMTEASSGMQAGAFGEIWKQKGVEVGKRIHGELLFGGKYGFEYGKIRNVIKSIAAKQGWKFKLAIFKPKG
ncbi:MAG: zinc ribbon domain-containing protein [Candidatus Omnitrophica bacterium]|nr:zinc ribbon domain-containing protein [Candidatus Omnitrophota bacterium]